MKKRLVTPDPFLTQMKKLLIPIVVQNLFSAAVSSADVIMLNFVGQSAIAAVSLAVQYASVLFMVFYGLGTGATVLSAQYYGKNDLRAIETVEGIALRFSLLVALVFAAAALLLPESMMRLFTDEEELIRLGASYLRIVSVSYVCWSITEVYLAILRSIGRVAISTVLQVSTFLLNILLNAVFIFGLFGAPKLGVQGVAIATSASRLLELAACFAVSAMRQDVKLRLSAIFAKNKPLFSDFLRVSLPAVGNDVSWGVAFSMYAVILGHLGSDAVAANSFVSVVRNFGTVLGYGVASAGGILLGNVIGAGRLDDARGYAKRILRLAVISGAVGGALILIATPFTLRFADVTETARHYLKYMMLINVYYVMGAAVNTTLIGGVFRAGGDTRWGFLCDTIDMWAYAVPLGFFAAFVLKLPVLWVYFLLCTDEFVKWPWVFKHYRSEKWLNNITRDDLF